MSEEFLYATESNYDEELNKDVYLDLGPNFDMELVQQMKVSNDMSGMKRSEDIGRGTWYVMHTLSYQVDKMYWGDDENNLPRLNRDDMQRLLLERRIVIRTMQILAETFICEKCRKHFLRYMRRYPPPDTGEYLSLFYWTIRFHNIVNIRLNLSLIKDGREPDKIIMNPRSAFLFFSGSSCKENCGNLIISTSDLTDTESNRTNVKTNSSTRKRRTRKTKRRAKY